MPLAMLSDLLLPEQWLVEPQAPNAFSVLAALAVVGGFVAINCAPRHDSTAPRAAGDEPCPWRWRSMRAPLLGGRERGPTSSSSRVDEPSGLQEGPPMADAPVRSYGTMATAAEDEPMKGGER